MSLEIRPYREDETAAFDRVGGIVFGNHTGKPRDPAAGVYIAPEWTLCVFEEGILASTYAAFPFVMRLNGGKAPAAGVTMVGTLPEFRRRGHLRRIMQADFERRYEQRMEPLAVLLASIAAIYQRYGYAICSSKYRYSIDPRWVGFSPSLPASTGTWREGTKDELPLLQSLYREFSGPRNGYLHRAPVIWEMQVLGHRNDPPTGEAGPSLIHIYEEGGEPRGYLTWAAKYFEHTQDGAGPGQRVYVRDFVWLTPGAYRAGWEFLKRFDLAARVSFNAAPADDPAFDIMLDPRELNATRGDWLLGRIIDLERTLPLRPYGAEGRVVFDVRDEMCPWNAGRWSLEAGPAGAKVSRSDESAELSLDIATLAQLLFGQVSPSRAVRYGRAEASRDARLDLWDAMWRTEYAPFCPDAF